MQFVPTNSQLLERSMSMIARAGIARFGNVILMRKISMNPAVQQAKYAVRGAILERAMEIEKDLLNPETASKWPFEKIVRCNIGNPQALGQRAPKFSRHVLSLLMNPELIGKNLYSQEAEERAQAYLAQVSGNSIGAYSDSKGIKLVREEVADFIYKRDGFECDPDNIYITDGASTAIKRVVSLLMTGDSSDALFLPFPQYPLYSALVSLSGGVAAPYYLTEGDWSINSHELEINYQAAIDQGKKPRAFVFLNPGNPSGATMNRQAIETIIRFCQDKKLPLLADEVYQDNIYHGPSFISARKVVHELGAHDLPLFSFHSISKGFTGECGLRGGYMEVTNLDNEFKAQISKLANMSLCSNVPGQIAVGLMVNPPSSEIEAHNYKTQRDEILASLKRRSEIVADTLNALPGISCPRAQGALYVFPSIQVPKRAVLAAKQKNIAPDLFYCIRMLEATGLVTVPGSGFGQREGTFHFRSSFLPSESDIHDVMKRLETFHLTFLDEFADEQELQQLHSQSSPTAENESLSFNLVNDTPTSASARA
uniref:Aminotransferase class I/classII large domain-containing protein n=1 Tax=Aureoumbra lagunensis TaxID=44058 RepID=A0A7S3JTD7_9STRA